MTKCQVDEMGIGDNGKFINAHLIKWLVDKMAY
jgi:hypothetical protein